MQRTVTDGRKRRGLANKQSILKAARDIFLEKGYVDNTMLDISQKAGVGYGTLYTHFSGKDDILKHLIDEIANDFEKIVNIPYRPESAAEVEKRIAKEIAYLLNLAKTHQLLLQIAHQAMGQSQSIKDHWDSIFQQHIDKSIEDFSYSFEKGLTKTGLTPRIVAKTSVFIIKEFFWDVVLGREDDIETISKDVAALFLHGSYR